MIYIRQACVGAHVGLIVTCMRMVVTHVGSARLFRYQRAAGSGRDYILSSWS